MLLEDNPASSLICSSSNVDIESKLDYIDVTDHGDVWPQYIKKRGEITIHASQVTWVGASELVKGRNKERLFSTDIFNCVIFNNGTQIGSTKVLVKELNISFPDADSIVLVATGPFEILTNNLPDNGWHHPTQEDLRAAKRLPESNREILDKSERGFRIIP